MTALPNPPSWTPPSPPAGVPIVQVSNSTQFQAAFDRLAKGEFITVDVLPKTILRFPQINDDRGATIRNLWADPMRRPLITSLKASLSGDLPIIMDMGGGFAGYMAGACYVDIDGFKFDGNTWGFIMGQAGGSGISNWGREGIQGTKLRRVCFRSANEAALILSGERVRDIEIVDFQVTGGREGLYIGFGGNDTKNPALEPDILGVQIRRGEIFNWGTKTGAEAIDWKHGTDVLIEDVYAHHGRCFSQGVIMAPGPNNIGTWRTKPSGTIRRVAIGHITLEPGRSSLDGSGVYLSMPNINVFDLTVFDIPGAAVLRGKNALAGPNEGSCTVDRVRAAACGNGAYYPDGWGWEGVYPTVKMTNVDTTAPSGDRKTWTLSNFSTAATLPSTVVTPPSTLTLEQLDVRLKALESMSSSITKDLNSIRGSVVSVAADLAKVVSHLSATKDSLK